MNFWHATGFKPKTSVFLHVGSSSSFFFSFSTHSHFHFKHRRHFFPRFHAGFWPWWHSYSCFGFWPYYSPYSVVYRPRVIYRPVTTVYVPRTEVVYKDVCPYTEREAWELLAQGADRLDDAVNAFHCLAEEEPYDGLTLIGYSIVAAGIGDFDRATSIMRHAVRVDREALRHVPADARIDDAIIDLIGNFAQVVQIPGREADGLFMVAALRTILPDPAAAHFAVSQAIEHGDEDASAHELRDLLTKMLHEELFQ